MAINLFNTYQPRINPPDADYPTGSIRDKSGPLTDDGTPLTALWGNDLQGFTDALLDAGGVSHSGDPDTATSSQRLQALLNVIANAIGLIPVSGGGTLEEGKRYWILDGGTYTLPDITSLPDSSFVEIYKIGGNVEPLIQVDGTNSEEIDYFNPKTGELLDTDVSATHNIYAPLILILNGNKWEI